MMPPALGMHLLRRCKIAIIGTGFAGLGMAIRLQQNAEHDFQLFEREAGIGGTWYLNRYPGCACDVPSHLYSFSFAPNSQWSQLFAPREEILAYLQGLWRDHGLAAKTQLNTEVNNLRWDEREQLWTFRDQHGQAWAAQHVIAAMGGLSTPKPPDIPGLNSFTGRVMHTQLWDSQQDLRGQRVAVIGTGASAIQLVPQLQPLVAQLDIYQRTPAWIMPKPQHQYSLEQRALFERKPGRMRVVRGIIYSLMESRALAYNHLPVLLHLMEEKALAHLHQQVSDPALRQRLTPDYRIGCKRVLLSNDFYPALSQPNVQLLDQPISSINSDGVIDTLGQHRPVDTLILASGFDAGGVPPRGSIVGRNGQDLADAWQQGPQAYKGTLTSGFPNLFLLSGPNTGLGHNSVVYMIEAQINYVLSALKTLQQTGMHSLEVKPEVEQAYNDRLQARLAKTVWQQGGCASWYKHPVSGRNVTLWPGFSWRFRRITREFDLAACVLQPRSTPTQAARLQGQTA